MMYNITLFRNLNIFSHIQSFNAKSCFIFLFFSFFFFFFFFVQLRFGKVDKYMSNTNVFEHSGKVYSISENHVPQEIDLSTLETLGDWDLSTAWNRPFSSHPKVHYYLAIVNYYKYHVSLLYILY